LDGEESRTILLNGNEVIPSNFMPNISEVFEYTYFDEEIWIEGSFVDKASVLEDGIALSFTIIFRINLYDLGFRFGLHLFILFLFLIVHRAWCRHRFGCVQA